jgi:hypothetical protein
MKKHKEQEQSKELDEINRVRNTDFHTKNRLMEFECLMEGMKSDLSLLADEMANLISQADHETRAYYVSLHPEDRELFFSDEPDARTDKNRNEIDKARDDEELER